MTAAAMSPNIRPLDPASDLADDEQQAAQRAEKQYRLHPVRHGSILISRSMQGAQPAQQRGEERCAPRQIVQFDVFVEGMGAIAARSEAV